MKKEKKALEKEKIKIQKQLEKESKKNTVIKKNIQIGEFDSNNNNICSSVLKSGVKKGQQCGAKVKQNGLCARHLPKETIDIKEDKEDKEDNI